MLSQEKVMNGGNNGYDRKNYDKWMDQWRADARNCEEWEISGVQKQETVMERSVVSSRPKHWPSYEV